MQTLIESVPAHVSPEALMATLGPAPGRVLLRSSCFELPQANLSFVTGDPFLTLRSWGSRCELHAPHRPAEVTFGNPWRLLDALLARFELLDEIDQPFPLGGAFGFWGYDLRRFVEPRLQQPAHDDLGLPQCHVGFHDSLAVFDHRHQRIHLVATGMRADGSRDTHHARRSLDLWKARLAAAAAAEPALNPTPIPGPTPPPPAPSRSTMDRSSFCRAVEQAQRYIRAGDIYQVNLSQRFQAAPVSDPWTFWQSLHTCSPAPFAAFLDAGDFQLASTSPELFLRLSGHHALTRPIKGTRPRSADPTTDAQLTYELQTSPKEIAELVMITDLLRNDLGRIAEFGSVHVPDLLRLERFAHVQHLVSTVEARLRPGLSHLAALESCFPGGSITGAPKIRAMEIIDELEPVARGPYTGCAGYLGFNRESQLSILIRTAVTQPHATWYHAGAGIVADSDPSAEYDETLAKAHAFFATAPRHQHPPHRARPAHTRSSRHGPPP
ncbi:MAG: anthranilate synthase component I family protein [Verrucomicrobiales bacterium]|nr:anthranilate synthase component I family protein [Verrucomicrobiales bacterium]